MNTFEDHPENPHLAARHEHLLLRCQHGGKHQPLSRGDNPDYIAAFAAVLTQVIKLLF